MWPGAGENIFNYGLGWDSVKLYPFSEYGIKALAKGGDTALQHAILVVPEQKIAAAVLTSGGRSSTNQLMATELLLATLKEKVLLRKSSRTNPLVSRSKSKCLKA